jgi:hypothetical protein
LFLLLITFLVPLPYPIFSSFTPLQNLPFLFLEKPFYTLFSKTPGIEVEIEKVSYTVVGSEQLPPPEYTYR